MHHRLGSNSMADQIYSMILPTPFRLHSTPPIRQGIFLVALTVPARRWIRISSKQMIRSLSKRRFPLWFAHSCRRYEHHLVGNDAPTTIEWVNNSVSTTIDRGFLYFSRRRGKHWLYLRTRVKPLRAPDNSLRCSTPKSAKRSGSSRHERVRLSKMRQWPGQFIGFNANVSFSTSNENIFSA